LFGVVSDYVIVIANLRFANQHNQAFNQFEASFSADVSFSQQQPKLFPLFPMFISVQVIRAM